MPSGSRLRETAFAAVFFLLATAIFTWPISPHVADGLADIWDAKLNAWILHWDFHQIFRDPLHLYDANIFYPDRYALAFSENLLGAAVFALPLYAAGASTLAAYNVVFLLGMALSAIAAWALAREVTGDPLPSVIAGVVYAFCPWRLGQVPHIQHQWGAFLALSLLFLLRWLKDGRRRDAVLFGVCLAWNALCNVHYALFSGLLVALVLAYRGVEMGWRTFRPRLLGCVVAGAAAGLAVVPFFLPYVTASKLYGMERGLGEIDFYSGTWTAFLNPGGQNKLYGKLAEKFGKPEGELFPGVVAVALAGIAVLRRRNREPEAGPREVTPRRRRIARALDVLFVAGLLVLAASLLRRGSIGPIRIGDPGRIAVLLTLVGILRLIAAFPRRARRSDLGDFLRRLRIGPTPGLFLAIAILGVVVALGTHTPYYRFLVQSFGAVFRAIRAPARGVVLFDLALGVLAALALSEWLRSGKSRTRLLVVAVALFAIGAEYRAFPLDVHPTDPAPRPVDRWLASASFTGGVVEWPLGNWFDQEYEFRSTAHWKPLINGSSGFAPRSYEKLAAVLDQRPIPDAVWDMLAERRTAVLLFHPGVGEGETPAAFARAVLQGVASGRLVPARSEPHENHRDLVFAFVVGSERSSLPPDPDPDATRRALEGIGFVRKPPFGFLDKPAEDEPVASGAWSFGWALDASGIVDVLVSANGGAPFAAAIGQPHPGVAQIYPGYPGADKPGFGFALPRLPAGRHTLTVTLVARNGGRSVLSRSFVVK